MIQYDILMEYSRVQWTMESMVEDGVQVCKKIHHQMPSSFLIVFFEPTING